MIDERLAWHFENWARFMRNNGAELSRLGYPSHSACFHNGGGESNDNKEIMYERVDLNDAIQMDAIISGLNPIYKQAINHRWLGTVFNMPSIDDIYADACFIVINIARHRGLH